MLPGVSPVATSLLIACALALLFLPLRWAALPLLVGACYTTLGQEFTLGPFHLPVLRLLIVVGFIRVILRGEGLAGFANGLDALMLGWGVWALVSSLFHENASAALVNRMGLVFNGCGLYFLFRVFCRSLPDVLALSRIIALVLIPLSLEMLFELETGRNLFAVFGNVNEFSDVRGGSTRAQGSFAHPILAGSVGAASLPLMLALWRGWRLTAIAGAAACILMVYASASSGPILSAAAAVVALAMWPLRRHMRLIRWSLVAVYVLLEMVMKAPAYFLLARIDLTGSSTSWHRAALIDAAIEHLSEWLLVGTDFTRHWMSYGVGWSGDHVDITNYYVNMGVYGGLPLMLLFIAILAKAFSFVGRETSMQGESGVEDGSRFVLWALGSALFVHAVSFMSISYFDQSVVFFYLVLAATPVGRAGNLSTVGGTDPTAGWRALPVSRQAPQ